MLVGDDGKPLLCDFGLSRTIKDPETVSIASSNISIRGSIRWLAYERYRKRKQSDNPMYADMWAFGMTIYVRSFYIFRRYFS